MPANSHTAPAGGVAAPTSGVTAAAASASAAPAAATANGTHGGDSEGASAAHGGPPALTGAYDPSGSAARPIGLPIPPPQTPGIVNFASIAPDLVRTVRLSLLWVCVE